MTGELVSSDNIDLVQSAESNHEEQSNIVATGCFTEDVLVKTSEGLIKIKDINKKHIISNQKVLGIAKIKYSQSKIVTVKKDAFGENQPSEEINVAPYHLFLINNILTPIVDEINGTTIFLRKYEDEYLYNIILEENAIVEVNNMSVQSLDNKSLIAKIFDGSQSPNQRNKIIKSLNNYHAKLKLKPDKRHEDYRV